MSAVRRQYAAGTSVSIEKSKAEIDTLLGKHGAAQRGVMHDEESLTASVVFSLAGRRYKVTIPLPERRDGFQGQGVPRGWSTWTEGHKCAFMRDRWEQACRERWRGLLLLVRAKLEIVSLGLSTIEKEFLADLLLPNGETAHQTVGAYMQRLVERGYEGPLALPAHEDSKS